MSAFLAQSVCLECLVTYGLWVFRQLIGHSGHLGVFFSPNPLFEEGSVDVGLATKSIWLTNLCHLSQNDIPENAKRSL